MKPELVFCYKDPGGENALRPVVYALKLDGRLDVKAEPSDTTDFVLTASSFGKSAPEKTLTKWANHRGIPSLGVLDFWSNYRERWPDEITTPTRIAVMDELALHEMVQAGFDADRISITGQPAFDCLKSRRLSFTTHRRYWVKTYYGFKRNRKTLVFASQPHSKQKYNYGYNEHSVIREVIRACEALDYDLIIRPHPRENLGDLMPYTSHNVTVKRSGMVHELLMAADLVIGMNTELLVEACYLGCQVLSIQPDLIGEDVLPTNRIGASNVIYQQHLIKPTLAKMVNGEWTPKTIVDQEPATPKVMGLIYEMMGL